MKYFVSITIMIFVHYTNGNYAQILNASEIFDKVAKSVVKVYASDFYGIDNNQGSGVVIEKNTVVTNYHIFDGKMDL